MFLSLNHQVRVVLFRGGNSQKELVFQASEKGPSNWYSAATLISSSWSDLKTETTNVFKIESVCKHSRSCRVFLINRQGNDCSDAEGWVMFPMDQFCTWNTTSFPVGHFMYSKGDTYARWSDESESKAKYCCIYRFAFQKLLDVKPKESLITVVLNVDIAENRSRTKKK